MPDNKIVMKAAVFTAAGVKVVDCESLQQAEFSAKERSEQAEKMGLTVRYKAGETVPKF